MRRERAAVGCLLGGGVGDAVGLAGEGLGPRRLARRFPDLDGPRLLGRRGMVSDDTEHACLTAQALAASGGDPERFGADLAWRLRGWFLMLPAGCGLATLRACAKLCLGWSWRTSGVWSAGNGPCMRSPFLGAVVPGERLRELVRISTRLTHVDPRAQAGAMAVALAARLAAEGCAAERLGSELTAQLRSEPEPGDLAVLIERAAGSAARREPTDAFARALGLGDGVTGYALHTVPVALHAWLTHPADVRGAVLAAVGCGGDTDTTAAIAGALAGAAGPESVPRDWVRALVEWPRTPLWMAHLARVAARAGTRGEAASPPRLPLAGVALRNGAFLAIVLAHGLRRLLPPY